MTDARQLPVPHAELASAVMPKADEYRRTGEWTVARLAALVTEHALAHPDRVAVVDELGSRRFTYDQLARDSNRIANYLVRAGVEVGDVVAVQLPNWYETVAIDIGALKAGAVVNTMLPLYREKELRHMLGVTGAKVIFTPHTYRGADHTQMIARAIDGWAKAPEHVIVDGPAGVETFRAWLDRHSDADCERAPAASGVSEIIFTSGTEAAPKAIMHTEETTSANIAAVVRSLGLSRLDVFWMPSPIGHSTGFNFGVRIALHLGARLVLQDRWDADAACTLIAAESVSYTVAATTFLTDLIRAANARRADLSSLRVFGCGGAPVPPGVVVEADAAGIPALRLYGQTEALLVTWNRPDAPLDKRINTDGSPIDGVDVEIRDDDGAPCGRNVPGEIWVKSSGTCVGFYADPERTAAKFRDGWVLTGDLGVIDNDGFLTIVGRKSEIIIRGGLNVAPREIEDQIVNVRGVKNVAVIGLPDERLGELTCACVVLDDGADLTLDDLTAELRADGMATYKLPQRLEVVDAIPMTSTGKVQRHLLVQHVLNTA